MTLAFPLQWPEGWPRFKGERESGAQFQTGAEASIRKLENELRLLGASKVVISSNVAVRRDGTMKASDATGPIADPGVAIYFELNGKAHAMARDKFKYPAKNVHSLALAIEAMRAIERHGGKYMMERSFSGFAALPAPSRRREWWEVLGVREDATIEQINTAWRAGASRFHPDRPGGSHDAVAAINAARDAGLAARSLR